MEVFRMDVKKAGMALAVMRPDTFFARNTWKKMCVFD